MYGNSGQGHYTSQGAHHARFPSQPDLMGHTPSFQFQQTTPQGSQYGHSHDHSQSNTSQRQLQQSAFSSPMTDSTQQHYVPPPRGVLGSSHSHSKSSPIAALDPKYMPFSHTTPSATPSASTRPFAPQTPTSAGFSPLGLSDIRPSMSTEPAAEAGPAATYDASSVQTNSSYLAPWPTYAYDWCKWPVMNGNGCGKMALGSYLEDPHNFVSKTRT